MAKLRLSNLGRQCVGGNVDSSRQRTVVTARARNERPRQVEEVETISTLLQGLRVSASCPEVQAGQYPWTIGGNIGQLQNGGVRKARKCSHSASSCSRVSR